MSNLSTSRAIVLDNEISKPDDVTTFFENAWKIYVNRTTYTPLVRNYLLKQSELVSRFLQKNTYSSVIVAGAGDGSLLMDMIVDLGLNYYGIDFIESAVYQLRSRIERTESKNVNQVVAGFVGDIVDFANVMRKHSIDTHNSVVVLPFNLIGTLSDPVRAIQEISTSKSDILNFSYKTDDESTEQRLNYYLSCGFKDVHTLTDDYGILFTSEDGLHSYAFRDTIIEEWLRVAGYKVQRIPFDPIGLMITGIFDQ